MKNGFFHLTIPICLFLTLLLKPAAESSDLFYLQGQININKASKEELMMLPYIGVKRASEIIAYREKTDGFKDIKELVSIQRLGKDTYHSIRQYLALKGKSDLHYSKYSKFVRPTIVINTFKGPILDLNNNKYFFVLLEKIREAKKNIFVCMYLFKTTKSPDNFANKVLKELTIAAKRGVRVEVLLEENNRMQDDLNSYNHFTAKKLRNAAIKVRFDNQQIITHSKFVIIDEKLVFIGSHNLSHTALSKSNETSLMVDSKDLAKTYIEYYHNLINK